MRPCPLLAGSCKQVKRTPNIGVVILVVVVVKVEDDDDF